MAINKKEPNSANIRVFLTINPIANNSSPIGIAYDTKSGPTA